MAGPAATSESPRPHRASHSLQRKVKRRVLHWFSSPDETKQAARRRLQSAVPPPHSSLRLTRRRRPVFPARTTRWWHLEISVATRPAFLSQERSALLSRKREAALGNVLDKARKWEGRLQRLRAVLGASTLRRHKCSGSPPGACWAPVPHQPPLCRGQRIRRPRREECLTP